jgi:L-asparaginase
MRANLLLIYSGGTIGSMEDPETGSLFPVDFARLAALVPELSRLPVSIHVHAFPKPKDSSDIRPEDWIELVSRIEASYADYDGFVILHGTDTMAYTASALSFMLQGLAKPVILTGSQLPMGKLRTDGKENLLTAIEIAAARDENGPIVPEVAIYFEYKLYRGNRCHKHSASHFNAYASPNYPLLAEAGVQIRYNREAIANFAKPEQVSFLKAIDTNVFVLTLYPGIGQDVFESVLRVPGLHTVILQSFGAGNGPLDSVFFDFAERCRELGILIFNISQCRQGAVNQGMYATSGRFESLGISGGADCGLEAAITKSMVLGAMGLSYSDRSELMTAALCGELS